MGHPNNHCSFMDVDRLYRMQNSIKNISLLNSSF